MKNQELKITKEKVLEAASKCSTAKATLITLFPEVFKAENKIDRIKTIEDVFEECGVSNYKKVIRSIEDNDLLSEKKKRRDIADYILEHVSIAFNDGQSPEEWQDWSENNNQSKYLPYFYMSPFRLSGVSGYYYCYSDTGAGARFYFKRREDAEYCAKQFEKYYKDLNI